MQDKPMNSQPNPVVSKNIVDMFKKMEQKKDNPVNIVDMFKMMDQSKKNTSVNDVNNDMSDISDIDDINDITEVSISQTQKNHNLCRMLKAQLNEFYDDIYIPIKYFQLGQWKISKILYSNEDALFYNDMYLIDSDKDRFYQVFDKYVDLIEEIMSTESKLYVFFKKWTDTTGRKWKPNKRAEKSYIRSVLNDKSYQIISPAYITNLFCELSKKYKNNSDLMKTELKKNLDEIIVQVKRETSNFRKIYKQIVNSYVYEQPIDHIERSTYVSGFMNMILLAIIDFAEQLINLNIYAVHPIIENIINYYVPMDEINSHDITENGYPVCIV